VTLLVLACSKEVVMRRRPFLLGLAVLLGSNLVAGAAAPAGAGLKPPEVPPAIQVPADHRVVLDVVGRGVQIYDCPAAGAAWTFREPAAVLYGRGNRPVGIHFRGPTFEAFDGSSVLGTLDASTPAPDPTRAIPWLRLRAVSTQGDGVLARVDYVQRIETRGGVAPAGPCDPAADRTVAVPYRARYVFFTPVSP
jgi:Protein of unknown function (DUF3455)